MTLSVSRGQRVFVLSAPPLEGGEIEGELWFRQSTEIHITGISYVYRERLLQSMLSESG